jgi:hypothetical protein
MQRCPSVPCRYKKQHASLPLNTRPVLSSTPQGSGLGVRDLLRDARLEEPSGELLLPRLRSLSWGVSGGDRERERPRLYLQHSTTQPVCPVRVAQLTGAFACPARTHAPAAVTPTNSLARGWGRGAALKPAPTKHLKVVVRGVLHFPGAPIHLEAVCQRGQPQRLSVSAAALHLYGSNVATIDNNTPCTAHSPSFSQADRASEALLWCVG